MRAKQYLFSEFEPKSKKDWQQLVINELAHLKFNANDVIIDAYVTSEDLILNQNELLAFYELMQKSHISTQLLFEEPSYKTFQVAQDTPLEATIKSFIDANIHIHDIHYYGFVVELNDQYLHSIAKIRALRILMLRLWPCIDAQPNYIFPIFTKVNFNTALSDHENLIPVTYQIMIAMITNMNGIIIGDNLRHQNSRLVQNIYHILQYESDIYNSKDASGGSFFIEQLTSSLVNDAWEKLIHLSK